MASGVVMAAVLVFSVRAQAPLPATDVTASVIQGALKQAPRDAVSDQPLRVVDVGGYNIGVYVVNRPNTGQQPPVLHDTKVTEIYYMLEGGGTLVTGGTLAGQSKQPANGPLAAVNTVRGTRIDGGVSRHVGKGDVVVIPGHVPHGWTKSDSDIAYLVFRPDPEKKLPLK
jgi:mannose-6-phosphate isomerase-like protein (cupin superfamily)